MGVLVPDHDYQTLSACVNGSQHYWDCVYRGWSSYWNVIKSQSPGTPVAVLKNLCASSTLNAPDERTIAVEKFSEAETPYEIDIENHLRYTCSRQRCHFPPFDLQSAVDEIEILCAHHSSMNDLNNSPPAMYNHHVHYHHNMNRSLGHANANSKVPVADVTRTDDPELDPYGHLQVGVHEKRHVCCCQSRNSICLAIH